MPGSAASLIVTNILRGSQRFRAAAILLLYIQLNNFPRKRFLFENAVS
jgi:hypothetical protein